MDEETSLSSLPRDCLALIFKSLDSTEDRKSFFSCSKDMRTCPQILALISKTTMDMGRQDALACLRQFPRGAVLRKLTITSCEGDGFQELADLSKTTTTSREKELLQGMQELELACTATRQAADNMKILVEVCPQLSEVIVQSCNVAFVCLGVTLPARALPRLRIVRLGKLVWSITDAQAFFPANAELPFSLRFGSEAISACSSFSFEITCIRFVFFEPELFTDMEEVASKVLRVEADSRISSHQHGRLTQVFPNAEVILADPAVHGQDEYIMPAGGGPLWRQFLIEGTWAFLTLPGATG